MLITSLARSNLHHSPLGPRFLNGLGGDASVETLQKALLNLSQATQRPAINPGVIDGTVNAGTIASVSAALGLLTESLPSAVYLALQAGLIVGSVTDKAKELIKSYAPQLTIAANTAAVKYKVNPPLTANVTLAPSTGFFSTLFPTGWYKQPSLGWLLVGLGGFGVYKLFISKSAKAA